MRFVLLAQFSTNKLPSCHAICSWLVSVGCVFLSGSWALGQDRPAPTSSAACPVSIQQLPDVLPREAAELEIALGRIRLVPDRFRIVRRHDQFDWPTVPTEATTAATAANSTKIDATAATAKTSAKPCSRSMQVATQDGRPTVKLSYADPREKWTLTVDGLIGAEWTRELIDRNPVIKVQYTQRPHQPIVITIDGVQKQPIKLSALTLWHLTEQKSPEFEQYVLPALVRLNSSWDLPQALAAAKRMRGYGEMGHSTSAKHELAQSIAELDSADRRVRETAKQKLRETGLAAQIPLEQLRGGPLSPQQRSTVEELLAELEPRSADTPTSPRLLAFRRSQLALSLTERFPRSP